MINKNTKGLIKETDGELVINKMNSLIKYGLYFVVAFSVLAFGAAEVWAFSIVEFVVFLLVFCCLLSRLRQIY